MARVFSESERKLLSSARDPVMESWIFWTRKEAAFKALRRREPELPFRWLFFENQGDRVVHPLGVLSCKTTVDAGWVHSVCTLPDFISSGARIPSSPELLHRVFHLTDPGKRSIAGNSGPGPESQQVRQMALDMLTEKTGRSWRIGWEQGVPWALGPGMRLPVSFSHHGRFGSVSILFPDK